MHQKSESKSRNRVSARAKLEVSNKFYAYFILKQKNVKYGVFYYFSAVSFNYGGHKGHVAKIERGQDFHNCSTRSTFLNVCHLVISLSGIKKALWQEVFKYMVIYLTFDRKGVARDRN